MRDGKPFRNIGVNMPDLFRMFLDGHDTEAVAQLKDAAQAGVTLVRCAGATRDAASFAGFVTDRTKWLAAFDRMLAAADANGIGLAPSLLFDTRAVMAAASTQSGKPQGYVDLCTPGTPANNLAIEYISAIVSRYHNDPRVLFWEVANELNLEADLSSDVTNRPAGEAPNSFQIVNFLIQAARLIHRLDKKHLVTSGNSDMRPAAWHLRQAMRQHLGAADPHQYAMDWTKDTLDEYVEMLRYFNPKPLDIISIHLYPPGADTPFWLTRIDTLALVLPWAEHAAERIGEPLYIGEFGEPVYLNGKEQPDAWTLDMLSRLTAEASPCAALWAWEFALDTPNMSQYSLSPQRTPILVKALTNANASILGEQAGTGG